MTTRGSQGTFGQAHATLEISQHFRLIQQLGVLAAHRLELDRNLLARANVHSCTTDVPPHAPSAHVCTTPPDCTRDARAVVEAATAGTPLPGSAV